jgi:hypothetical protein
VLDREFAQAGIKDFLDPKAISGLDLARLAKAEDSDALEQGIMECYSDREALEVDSLLAAQPEEASDEQATDEGFFGSCQARFRKLLRINPERDAVRGSAEPLAEVESRNHQG